MSRWMTERRSVTQPFVIGRFVVGVIVAALSATAISAQTPSQEYVPATDIARESLPALPLLYTAYGFVFVALAVYVFLIWRRLAKVEQELADVRGRLAQRR